MTCKAEILRRRKTDNYEISPDNFAPSTRSLSGARREKERELIKKNAPCMYAIKSIHR